MRYLCLIYDNESRLTTRPRAEVETMHAEYIEYTEGIKQSGHHAGGYALQPTHTATTIRVRNGKTSTTDGPFAETKEQLGGFYLIEATDLNDAMRVAARIPSARTGCIEVRPVMETSPQ